MPQLRMRWLMILPLLLIFGVIAVCVWAGLELASPPRRILQDYHHGFLADPSAHGVLVKAFTISDGTPCLLVEPDSAGKIGLRGELRRGGGVSTGVTSLRNMQMLSEMSLPISGLAAPPTGIIPQSPSRICSATSPMDISGGPGQSIASRNGHWNCSRGH